MTFIVVLIGLLIERFFDWSHLRHWTWFSAYQRMIGQKLANKSAYLALAVSIIPLLLAVLAIEYFLQSWLYGFPNVIFKLLLLIYCLGPQNLWADSFACINALVQGDTQYAAEKLKSAFDITDTKYAQALHKHLLSRIFIEANRRVFAVIFWFTLLGPIGALLYRAICVSAQDSQKGMQSVTQDARKIESILDWPAVRLFTFIFALGGHFSHVLACWRRKVSSGLEGNEALLTECGIAALGYDDQDKIPEDGSVENNAISLLDRSFAIAIVFVALIALISIT